MSCSKTLLFADGILSSFFEDAHRCEYFFILFGYQLFYGGHGVADIADVWPVPVYADMLFKVTITTFINQPCKSGAVSRIHMTSLCSEKNPPSMTANIISSTVKTISSHFGLFTAAMSGYSIASPIKYLNPETKNAELKITYI